MTLWAGQRPVAFTLTINSPQESGPEKAEIANFHGVAGGAEFDLNMPRRSYSSVRLEFARHDLILEATVSAGAGKVPVGRFVLFDLSGSGHAANTTMHLGEREDTVLHVRLDKPLARGELLGAWVPPSRSEETVFTTVASAPVHTEGTESTAEFDVPRGLPVERVVVNTASSAEDYRRSVTVEATAANDAKSETANVTGMIQRMHGMRDNVPLRAEDHALDAVLLNNQSSAMRVKVSVENGSAAPLPIENVELQMRQRKLCFTAWPGVEHWRLFYGAPTVRFTTLGGGHGRSLVLPRDPVVATLGPEHAAANFHPLSDEGESRPGILLASVVAFVALLCVLMVVFLRTVRIPHVKR
jgi:hypothetical protein